MKTSINLFLTDIMPERRKMYHKLVKNRIFAQFAPHQVFEILKKSGIDGIEVLLPQFAPVSDKDIKMLKELLTQCDMPVLSVHQSLRFFSSTKIKEITRLAEVAHMLSAKVIVLHMNSAQKQIFDPEYVAALHALEEKYDVVVTFENMEKHIGSLMYEHRWEGVKFADLVRSTGFHITFDIVHLATSGGDILEFYEKNKDIIANIHLSDYKHHYLNSSLRPMRYKHMPIGKGDLPIKQLMYLLYDEKYDGLLTMEMHTDLEGIKESAKILKTFKSLRKT